MKGAFDPYPFVRPVLHALDPETAHEAGLRALEYGLFPAKRRMSDPVLETTLFGRRLSHPLGLAAGFDKNGRVFAPAFGLGFSFVEIGGVTPLPQAGNATPRVFRLPRERAIVNRIGFANDGMDVVASRIRDRRGTGLLGINLAANTDSVDPPDDFVRLALRFAPLVDYITLDISCPNTRNGRLFLERGPLEDLLGRLAASFEDAALARPKIVAKLGPDLDEARLADLLSVLCAHRIDGLVISNTTSERPSSLTSEARNEVGGLSGPPLFERSTRTLAHVYAATYGKLTLIGVGGIASGKDAYDKIRAGATALQLYTALVYGGPPAIRRIVRELAGYLRHDGFSSVKAAVGADVSSSYAI